jgi:hypothetical protein
VKIRSRYRQFQVYAIKLHYSIQRSRLIEVEPKKRETKNLEMIYLRCNALREVWSQRSVNKNQPVKLPHILSYSQSGNTEENTTGRNKR